MRKYKVLPLTLFALFFLASCPIHAQILTVTGEYRVVEVDRGERRIGVALRDADPNIRQNWVYIKTDAKIVRRVFLSGRAFRDQMMSSDEFLNYVDKGTLLRIHGGRDWDRAIHADKIWF